MRWEIEVAPSAVTEEPRQPENMSRTDQEVRLDEVLQQHNVAFYISETKMISEQVSPGAEMMNLTAWRWPWKHSWAEPKVQYGMEDSEPVGVKKNKNA